MASWSTFEAFSKKYNTPHHVFVQTILWASRPRSHINVDTIAVKKPSSLLQMLHGNGAYFALNFKRAIAEFAGVQMGPDVARTKAAAMSLGMT